MKKKKNLGFTLVEIMIVVAIIGILATLAYPAATRARVNTTTASCLNTLRQIEAGKAQYGFDNGASPTNMTDLYPTYIKKAPICPSSGVYTLNAFDEDPTCTVGGGHTL